MKEKEKRPVTWEKWKGKSKTGPLFHKEKKAIRKQGMIIPTLLLRFNNHMQREEATGTICTLTICFNLDRLFEN